MKDRKGVWPAAAATLLCLLFAVIAVTSDIVSREGVDGLFNRKRAAVKQIMPEAMPIVDEVEERVRGER